MNRLQHLAATGAASIPAVVSNHLPSFTNDFAASLLARIAAFGPFQPMISSSLSSSSSVAMNLPGWLGEVAYVSKALLRVRASGHGEQTVVSFGVALALLLYLKDADDAAGQDNPREGRRIVNHHDVDRIAVIGLGRRHETPIMRVG
jgi:hypothetical protein